MDPTRLNRRRFLTRAFGLVSASLLAGCDSLSQTTWFPHVLDSAENVNYTLQHWIAPKTVMAREYTEADLSRHFKSNGTHYPNNAHYQQLADNDFKDWRLKVSGLVDHPGQFSLEQLRAMPARAQITRHDCVEGWSCIGKWKGVRLSALLDKVQPRANARYVVFYSADFLYGAKYYESIDFDDAYHPQTILAYAWNDEVLPIRYGAPLRLRVERQLGYKMAKYLMGMELVEDFSDIRGGKGGYWEDRGYAWYAGI